MNIIIHASAALPIKQRCPNDGHVTLYFTAEGISLRCRICKGIHVIPWQDVIKRHAELHDLQSVKQ